MKRGLGQGLLLVFLLGGAAGCKSNPYPGDVNFEPVVEAEPYVAPTEPDMFMRYEAVMQFIEGEEAIYKIEGVVASGNGRLEITGLPAGAMFDEEEGEIRWTPDFLAANDPEDVTVISKEYKLTLNLYDNESITYISRPASIIVFDVSRDMLIWTASDSILREGRNHTQNIRVADEDFPGELIELYSPDLPQDVELSRTGPTGFRLRFRPGYGFASRTGSNAQNFYRDINFRLQAVGPRGHVTHKVVRWRVHDTRQRALILASSRMTAHTPELRFFVTVQDPNQERFPDLRLVRNPAEGRVRVNRTATNGVEAIYEIHWSNIPANRLGTTQNFQLRACRDRRIAATCSEKQVRVTIREQAIRPPVINRSSWPLGTILEKEVDTDLVVPMRIIDPDTNQSVEQVEIESSSRDLEARWVNGRLTVRSATVGLYQFNVKAFTAMGAAAQESMIVRIVLPPPPPPPASLASKDYIVEGWEE